jgi:hypothetical protein
VEVVNRPGNWGTRNRRPEGRGIDCQKGAELALPIARPTVERSATGCGPSGISIEWAIPVVTEVGPVESRPVGGTERGHGHVAAPGPERRLGHGDHRLPVPRSDLVVGLRPGQLRG